MNQKEKTGFTTETRATSGLVKPRWAVVKFGGTSVASAAGWRCIAQRIHACETEGIKAVVVCSALSGVTNRLQALIDAPDNRRLFSETIESIRKQHEELLWLFGLSDLTPAWKEHFEQLIKLLKKLPGEQSPALHAKVMGHGELLSTTLGVQILESLGLSISWQDSRKAIQVTVGSADKGKAHYLNAYFEPQLDDGLINRWGRNDCGSATSAIIVPGFIASDTDDETVLLGRGGSDTSASYLGVLLGAERVEIWTDVPGLFSANPALISSARLLRHISYLEAQEIASAGGKVLHPRCLRPLRLAHIPLHVYSTHQPELEGSTISDQAKDFGAQVKAIVCSQGITLISMETLGMWQQVGFLADAFTVFKRYGLSVDSIATSESNVTVTLDPGAQLVGADRIERLHSDLSQFCRVRITPNCSAVTLVGRGIRTILHRLGPALEAFEERRIYLLSQAANDLNLSVVVPREHADALARQLHHLLIPREARIPEESVFGPSWEHLQQGQQIPLAIQPSWYRQQVDALNAIAEANGSAYVYHLPTVQKQIQRLKKLQSIDRIIYAMKANNHPQVLKTIRKMGIGFDCVSMSEVAFLSEQFVDLDYREILFTPNFAPVTEYQQALDKGLAITLDNLFVLQQWPELLRNTNIVLRIDPGQGHGHHEKVKTAGTHSKFGVPLSELTQAQALCKALGIKVVGLHVHIGSGLTIPDNWRQSAALLVDMLDDFPDVKIIDLGGGLSVPTKPGDSELDLAELDKVLLEVKAQANREIQFWLEPGRFLVSEAGVLLARVTQTKGKGDVQYVGVSTGMNSLIRPALYGAYHDIINLSQLDNDQPQTLVNVVGPICETGDILGMDRMLPPCAEGDVLLIANAGAYGSVMSSCYNLREPAAEFVLDL